MNSARTFAVVANLLLVGVSQSAIAASASREDAALKRGDYWTMWERATNRECPGNHLEWEAYSDEALYLVNGFLATLSPSDLAKVQRVADDRCREEIGGWGCYMAVHIDGFQRFGLLKRFAKYGCDHYQCDKDGLCENFPDGR
jgi:hypothetical protein